MKSRKTQSSQNQNKCIINLNAFNSREIKQAADKLKVTPSFIVNQILNNIDIVPVDSLKS